MSEHLLKNLDTLLVHFKAIILNRSIRILIAMISLGFATSCGTNDSKNIDRVVEVDSKSFLKTVKYSPGDPFIETIKESEYFKVSGLENKVIETDNGTLISIPKAAFRDSTGRIIEEEVTIEVADISTFEEQFNSNILSPVGQDLILNGGALYINATQNGTQLYINEESPIYVELNQEHDQNIMIFEGIRNDKGEMQWINPEPPSKFLIPVPLSTLDFLPEGFAKYVNQNLPFGNFERSSDKLIDSLYFSLPTETFGSEIEEPLPDSIASKLDYYWSNSELAEQPQADDSSATEECAAINPSSIKALLDPKFSNTYIATKQFEQRVKEIHKSRNQNVLDLYLNNLNLDLSQCDSKAAELLSSNIEFSNTFEDFANERWRNVKNLPASAIALSSYYKRRVEQVEKELKKVRDAYQKEQNRQNQQAHSKIESYKKLLVKRQRYRLKKHGFVLKKTGWVAPAYVIIKPIYLYIKVPSGGEFDRVHVYTIDERINSIFSWQGDDKVHFNYAVNEDDSLYYKMGSQIDALVVAYKGEQPYYETRKYTLRDTIYINFDPKPTSQNQLNNVLRRYDRGSKWFNSLKVDLNYQSFFYQEIERQKKVGETQRAMSRIRSFVFDCSNQESIFLFSQHCGDCHHTERISTGPPLTYISEHKDENWFIDFTQETGKYLTKGLDEYTDCMLDYWQPKCGLCPGEKLSDGELNAIWSYLGRLKNVTPDDRESRHIRDYCISRFEN